MFARFAEFLAGVPILLLFVVLFNGHFGLHTVNMLFAIVLQFMILTGLSFILASVNVLYRDVQRFMRLVMRCLFYGSPIIYPLEKVVGADSRSPDGRRRCTSSTRLSGIMQLHRSAWISEITASWLQVGVSVGFSVFILFFGRWLFYKMEPAVLKEL